MLQELYGLDKEGVVQWFDDLSGEGMVACTDGKSYYLHWSAIKGDFPARNGKARWASVKEGWKVAFKLYSSQVSELYVLEESEPGPRPSIYTDKTALKAELAAIKVMVEERWPERGYDYDEFHKLSRAARKLTDREDQRLEEMRALEEIYNKAIRELRSEETSLVVAVYRKYSKFPLFKAG